MQFFLTYILQASIAGTFCYLMYYFFLRKTTFFKWNRTFFLFAIALSVVLPALNFLPASLPDKPVNAVQRYIPDLSFRGKTDSYTDWKFVLANLFYAGIVLMAARFLIQIFGVILLGKKSKKHKLNGVVIVDIAKNISPFSFFNHIYINSRQHNADDFEQILRHEIVHAKEGHSIDILIAEIYNIFFWFNPFAWMLKTSLKQNLEFITDTKVLKSGVNAKLYQYCLLKVSGIHTNMAAANHFNFIKLKNRIIMMNKKRSSQVNILKYLLLLPLVTFLLMSFNGTTPKKEFSKGYLPTNDTLPDEITRADEWEYAAGGGAKTDTIPEAPLPPPPPPAPGDVVKYIPKNKANKDVKIVTQIQTGKTTVTLKDGSKEEYNLTDETERKKFQSKYGELPPPPPPLPAAPAPTPPPVPKAPDAVNLNGSGNAQPVMFVDGKEIASIKEIDEKSIKSVEVFKDADAIGKYGNKGKNGVVVISTKATPVQDGVIATQNAVITSPQKSAAPVLASEHVNVVKETGEDKLLTADGTKNALFYVNGKQVPREEAIRIKTEDIYRINVIKDAASLKKYGDKGKHGVIEITTK